MILGSQIFIIGVVSLEKFIDVLDCVTSGINEIFVRCRCADELIGSSVLNILLGVLLLESHQLWD